MKIETITKLATVILCVSLVTIIVGIFVNWIITVIGIFGLIAFELLSAYVHEWHIEQEEEKY